MSITSCTFDPNAKPSRPATNEHSFGIDEYDEDAIEDYMSGLKGVVQFLSATQTADSVVIMQGQMLLGLALGQMKTAKIEIEIWPYAARNKAWQIKGSRMQKYNELVREESARVLSDPSYSTELKTIIKSIKLITKESLLAK
ncbi:MAG: hypothetical protein KUG79_08140 [Pseudomonadales bacterium]|nr:hypothetical protein [Pseudomonadales bacterium]